MRIVFWTDFLSIHQMGYMKALANLSDVNVIVIVGGDIPTSRLKMGWPLPDVGKANIIHNFKFNQEANANLVLAIEKSINIVFGIRGTSFIKKSISYLIDKKAKFGIISERRSTLGAKGLLRSIYYSYLCRKLNKKIDFFFALGSLGVEFFKLHGIDCSKLFNFSYAVSSKIISTKKLTSEKNRIILIGRMIPQKNIKMAIRGFVELSMQIKDLKVTIVGDGPLYDSIHQSIISQENLRNLTLYRQMDHQSLLRLISESSLLVLPSRYDGWGAVANEALTVGTPVVCSDHCGCKDLICNPNLGRVFKTNDVEDFIFSVYEILKENNDRDLIIKWSSRISGDSVAKYMIDALNSIYRDGAPPTPPWV